MTDIIVSDIDEKTLAVLRRKAEVLGVSVNDVARELVEAMSKLSPGLAAPDDLVITAEDRAARTRIANEMTALRGRTLKPFAADSTLVIREMRDTR
jgi:hypothetical protein